MNGKPILHKISSVSQTDETNVLVALVDLTDTIGDRYETKYTSRPDDPYGLAPEVRAAIQQWIADGKPVLPYEPPKETAPDSVSARQFKLQLLVPIEGYPEGIYDAVSAWVSAQNREVQIAFEYSGTFVRDEPMMQAGFSALGFTEEQGNAFFLAASKL